MGQIKPSMQQFSHQNHLCISASNTFMMISDITSPFNAGYLDICMPTNARSLFGSGGGETDSGECQAGRGEPGPPQDGGGSAAEEPRGGGLSGGEDQLPPPTRRGGGQSRGEDPHQRAASLQRQPEGLCIAHNRVCVSVCVYSAVCVWELLE